MIILHALGRAVLFIGCLWGVCLGAFWLAASIGRRRAKARGDS